MDVFLQNAKQVIHPKTVLIVLGMNVVVGMQFILSLATKSKSLEELMIFVHKRKMKTTFR